MLQSDYLIYELQRLQHQMDAEIKPFINFLVRMELTMPIQITVTDEEVKLVHCDEYNKLHQSVSDIIATIQQRYLDKAKELARRAPV